MRLRDLGAPMWLSVLRSPARGAFGPAELRTLGVLGGHVERALRMSHAVRDSQTNTRAMWIALDAIAAGVYVLDAERRLLCANARGSTEAELYFDPASARLVPRREPERRELERAIAAAGALAPGRLPRPCVVSGRDGGGLAVWAFPADRFARRLVDGDGVAHTTLLTMALEDDRSIDPAVIRDVFGLSLGEARLASVLWTGAELRGAAEHLGITEGTARVVLKRVFRKLGINRQAQLILRLSHLAQVARPDRSAGVPLRH